MAVMISLAACTDNQDATHQPQITATALPATNTNLLSVKQKFSNVLGKNNTFEQVKQDLVFEGVVVANDISGNLYQTLVVRHIGSQPGALDDQCITLGIKSSQLYSLPVVADIEVLEVYSDALPKREVRIEL